MNRSNFIYYFYYKNGVKRTGENTKPKKGVGFIVFFIKLVIPNTNPRKAPLLGPQYSAPRMTGIWMMVALITPSGIYQRCGRHNDDDGSKKSCQHHRRCCSLVFHNQTPHIYFLQTKIPRSLTKSSGGQYYPKRPGPLTLPHASKTVSYAFPLQRRLSFLLQQHQKEQTWQSYSELPSIR